jgi:hypothetical protein
VFSFAREPVSLRRDPMLHQTAAYPPHSMALPFNVEQCGEFSQGWMPFAPRTRQNGKVIRGSTIDRLNWRRKWARSFAGIALLAAMHATYALAQSAPDSQSSAVDPNSVLGTPTSVHGVVMNAATGEPLPRALVQVNGGSGIAVLTDGDGRFEADEVPLGPGVFQVTKPGFEDAAGAQPLQVLRDLRGYTHSVFVTPNTPALTFSMRPTNAIRGHIELSTGDIAQNIEVMLLQRQIHNGRAIWHGMSGARTNADGNFHFAHLEDGDYVVKAGPSQEQEMTGQPVPDRGRGVPSNGYPEIYYPDARDFSGAAHLSLSGGEQSDANLTMPLEPFHAVEATVVLPAEIRTGVLENIVSTEVVGPSGLQVPYESAFDAGTKRLWTRLPDGSYTLRVTAVQPDRPMRERSGTLRLRNAMTGQSDVTVAGHSVSKLRIPVGPAGSSPLQVMIARSAQSSNASGGSGRPSEVFVEVSQAGPLTDGMQAMLAQGDPGKALDTVAPAPGKYWVHTIVADPALCEDSFTAGSSNLGREPLTVGLGGATAPLTLNLRDNCASLKVSLPSSQAGMAAGEEAAYLVYVVPDRDFTTDAPSNMLRAENGSSFTFQQLTPGGYHVYTFAEPVELEYHNREVLAGLHGQTVTLTPGETSELVLEVPAQ